MNKAILMLAAVFGLGVVGLQAQEKASPSPSGSPAADTSPSGKKSTKHHKHHTKQSSKAESSQ
ncbi:MAG: hypothetical protein JO069_06980 [Verrucomicrobia bacterium]|nr:hypothetical protein [Verrucomicrobiota bacterium]